MRTLFDTTDDASIQERFERFLDANPQLYDLFKRFAEEARAAGLRRYSADALLHRIRWHVNVELRAVEGEDFKCNNVFSSRLARKLVAEDPERWDGFFETRQLKRV